jgi:hypothetical protein
VELRQRAGGKTITSATFYDSFYCSGMGEPVTRQYVFSNSSSTFKQGVGTVSGTISSYLCCGLGSSEVVLEEISLLK